ncbi:MAG: hypothetical protein LBQ12_15700 [Deltaproteobacteria bacterium]|jgi:hypothetical protein|nr:hypothetical protein [Deltaproteobacteria bacterium]
MTDLTDFRYDACAVLSQAFSKNREYPRVTVDGNGPGSNRAKRVLVWESVRGKKPKESRVPCLDGNMSTCEPDGLAPSMKHGINQAAFMM